MYRSLDAAKIIATIQRLRDRVSERFPQAGLSRVAAELLRIAHEAVERANWVRRPHLPLRIGMAALVILFVAILVGTFLHVKVSASFYSFGEMIQAVEASVNMIVLIGAGIFFLVTLEVRIKRRRALRILHELRAMAHIVDIHQLTKDPERMLHPGKGTASSPVRTMNNLELSRYLDYCSEMLSLIGKLAALYAQYLDDGVVLEAVDEVEDLTTGLSRKIWQKITLINPSPREETPPDAAI